MSTPSALPAEALDVFPILISQVGDLVGAAWPVVLAVFASSVGIKLFKKFANKAA